MAGWTLGEGEAGLGGGQPLAVGPHDGCAGEGWTWGGRLGQARRWGGQEESVGSCGSSGVRHSTAQAAAKSQLQP